MDDELNFERWELAIGKVVMALSRVEGELFMKYQSHFSKTKHNKDTFKERLQRIWDLYNSECGESLVTETLFEKIFEAIDYRNLVAHNPIFADTSGEILKFKISTIKQDDIALDIDELEKEALRISELGIQLSSTLRRWA